MSAAFPELREEVATMPGSALAGAKVAKQGEGQRAREGWERQRSRWNMILLSPVLLCMVMFFLFPLAILVLQSVKGEAGFTFAAYRELASGLYVGLFFTTALIALVVTVLSLVVSYPLAFFLAGETNWASKSLLLVIVVSLWLSSLARTVSWIIILQRNGVLNRALMQAGLTDAPLQLVYNQLGIYIVMTHIFIPYMVLMLVPSLRAIDTTLMRAASSLGANPVVAFVRIYLPLSLPGVVAACTIVFGMALGFFITPAIIGGGKVTTLVMVIQDQVQKFSSLRLAAATSVILLLICGVLMVAYEKLAGADRIFGAGK